MDTSLLVTFAIYVGVVGAGLLALAVFTALIEGATRLVRRFRKF